MNKYTKYLGIKHDYNNINCITFISHIYETEGVGNIFLRVWDAINYPEGKIKDGSNWSKKLNIQKLDNWLEQNTKKVHLTSLQEYDVIVFKGAHGKLLRHVGMYIGDNKFIHLPENSTSTITEYNHLWRIITHGAYRAIR